MDIKTGLLVLTLLAECFAHTIPQATETNLAKFFDHTDASAHIIGGNQAGKGSHPHMVVLTTGTVIKGLLCGGSLITQQTVLTAAHCIMHVYRNGNLANSLRATVGTHRWNSGGISYNISHNVTHQHYDTDTIKNDIGILITTSEVALHNYVSPVPITYSFIGGGVRSRVAGWGRTSYSGAISPVLLELTPTTIEGISCVVRVSRSAIELNVPCFTEPRIEVCTFHSAGYGTCNGDSGSALIRADDGMQFGIVSWGFPCARGAPDIFVRLSAYKNWLTAFVV